MKDEVYCTLEEMDTLNNQEKEIYQGLTEKAINEVKSKNREINKATIGLMNVNGVKIKIVATYPNKTTPDSPRTVEFQIKSIGLKSEVTDKLIEKYKNREINQNHVRDIAGINSIDNVIMLNPDIQMQIVNDIIENRNIQNDLDSAIAALYIIKNGGKNKFIVDNWYNEVLRLINKLHNCLDVDEKNIYALSSEKIEFLEFKIEELKLDFNTFTSTLESVHNESRDN